MLSSQRLKASPRSFEYKCILLSLLSSEIIGGDLGVCINSRIINAQEAQTATLRDRSVVLLYLRSSSSLPDTSYNSPLHYPPCISLLVASEELEDVQ